MINSEGNWILATVYDLLNVAIINPDDTEELALTLEGKKKKIKWEHFERFAYDLDLNEKQLKGIVKRFKKNKSVANEWIDNSFLSQEYKDKYKSLLVERYGILFEEK